MDETVELGPARSFLWRALRTPLADLLRGRVAGGRPLRELLVQARLPALVTSLLAGVASRTRLRSGEQLEVARELVAHFRDGLQSGSSADELVRRFGDPWKAARLIRRGKLRGRPLFSRVLRRGSQAAYASLGVLVLAYAFAFVRFYGGESEVDPTRLGTLVSRVNTEVAATTEDDRAWPLYEAALREFESLFETVAIEATDDRTREWNSLRPTSRYWGAFVGAVHEDRRILRMLHEATRRSRLGFELRPNRDSSDIGFEYFQVLTKLASILRGHALREAADSDRDEVLEDVIALLALGEHASQGGPFSVCCWFGWSTLTDAVDLVNKILARDFDVLEDEQLVLLADRLAVLGTSDPFSWRLDGDWEWLQLTWEALFTNDPCGEGRLSSDGLKKLQSQFFSRKTLEGPYRSLEGVVAPALGSVVAGESEIFQRGHMYMEEIRLQLGRPLWKRELPSVCRWLANLSDSSIESLRWLPLRYIPVFPLELDQLMIQRRDAALTVVALVRYRQKTRTWPDGLETLVPDLIPAAAIDRFNGEPLRYRVIEKSPVLYSVGVDGDDDNGRPPRPDEKSAYDWSGARHDSNGIQEARYDGDWVLWSIDPTARR